MIAYLDTSAAMKLIVEEAESAALEAYCNAPDLTLVATDLLETELRRAAARVGLPGESVTDALSRVDLYELTRSAFTQAGLLPGPLRSLDALHIVGALRIGVDVVLAYDHTMALAARGVGLVAVSPG